MFQNSHDSIKKREEFAVSLRQKKKSEILKQKRMKLTTALGQVRKEDFSYMIASSQPKQPSPHHY